MKIANGKIEMSTYKNYLGNVVTLYKNETGYMATITCGDIIMYSKNGDMMCGAKDEDSAIQLLLEWS